MLKGRVILKKIFYLFLFSMLLTSCATEEANTLDYGKDPMEYGYGSDYYGEFATDSGMNYAADAAAAATAWSSTEIEEVASWELMVQHGKYHATGAGKVYPYGEAIQSLEEQSGHNYWDEAKNAADSLSDNLKTAIDDLK